MLITTLFHVETSHAPDDFYLVFRPAFANKQESFVYEGTRFDISYGNPRHGFVMVSVDGIPKRVPRVFKKRRGPWFHEVSISATAMEHDTLLAKPGSYARPLLDSDGNPTLTVHALADPEGEHEANVYNLSQVIVWGKDFARVVEYYNELLTGTLEPHSPLS